MKNESLISIVVLLLLTPLLKSQENQADIYSVRDTINDFGLFKRNEPLVITLRFDITHYVRKRSKDKYMDAVLTYHINDKDSINRNIKLKSRGEFRNSFCDFPPVMLNFKSAEFVKSDLKNIKKMKLVTHCERGNEENLLREFLVYRLYNVMTDTSFRVRLVKIEYINTYKKTKPVSSWAFFIEPLEMMAERLKCNPVNLEHLTQLNIQPVIMDRVAIFNYMIGNSDWSVPKQHNVKVLSAPFSSRPDLGILVPYDFDYCGLVNAPYAIPAEGLQIKTVRDRIYLGICRDEASFIKAAGEFVTRKELFYRTINEFSELEKRTKKDLTDYLDTFFEQFDSRGTIIRNLLNECKKM